MTKHVTANNVDPLEFMRFLNDAKKSLYVVGDTTGTVVDEDGDTVRINWHYVMDEVVDYLEENASGRFWCGLGREDDYHFTDDRCEITVHLENPDDEAIVRQKFEVTEYVR